MTIQLGAAAHHLVCQNGHSAFSDLSNKSKSSNRKKKSHIKNILANPNAFSAAVVGDPKMRYVGVDQEAKLVLFHSVTPWVDGGATYYVGVIGDDISSTTRVLLPGDAFDSVNVVILKESIGSQDRHSTGHGHESNGLSRHEGHSQWYAPQHRMLRIHIQ